MEQATAQESLGDEVYLLQSRPGTYFKIIGEEITILLIYVDDAFFMGSNKQQVLSHKAQFMK